MGGLRRSTSFTALALSPGCAVPTAAFSAGWSSPAELADERLPRAIATLEPHRARLVGCRSSPDLVTGRPRPAEPGATARTAWPLVGPALVAAGLPSLGGIGLAAATGILAAAVAARRSRGRQGQVGRRNPTCIKQEEKLLVEELGFGGKRRRGFLGRRRKMEKDLLEALVKERQAVGKLQLQLQQVETSAAEKETMFNEKLNEALAAEAALTARLEAVEAQELVPVATERVPAPAVELALQPGLAAQGGKVPPVVQEQNEALVKALEAIQRLERRTEKQRAELERNRNSGATTSVGLDDHTDVLRQALEAVERLERNEGSIPSSAPSPQPTMAEEPRSQGPRDTAPPAPQVPQAVPAVLELGGVQRQRRDAKDLVEQGYSNAWGR